MSKLDSLIKLATLARDRNMARQIRVSALDTILKSAGVLHNPTGNIVDYSNPERVKEMRGGGSSNRELYDLKMPSVREGKKTEVDSVELSYGLSSRYSPDRPGVQALIPEAGVRQDPYTGKTYDYNDGFKTENGQVFQGGGVTSQSNKTKV